MIRSLDGFTDTTTTSSAITASGNCRTTGEGAQR